MRIVTWNCCKGPLNKKVARLDQLDADIVVIQECPRPSDENNYCLWFGDNPKQGVLVKSKGVYSLSRMEQVEGAPKFVIPLRVSGPLNFVLFAIWSKNDTEHRYIRGISRCLDLYQDILANEVCVVLGDFNSSQIWDRKYPEERNHSAVVRKLAGHGLESAYHAFFRELQGRESRPTYHFHWREDKPYHIDYCFIPRAWLGSLANVTVGTSEDWGAFSDHRPLFVDIAGVA